MEMGKTILESANGIIQFWTRKEKRSGRDATFKSEINEFVSEDYRTKQTTTSAMQELISNSLSGMAGRRKRIRNLFWVSKDRCTSNRLVFYDGNTTAYPIYVLDKPDTTTQPFHIYKENIRGFFVSQSLYFRPVVLSLTNWIGAGFKLDPNEP